MSVARTLRGVHAAAISAAMAVCLVAGPAHAQRVEFQGRGEFDLDRRIRSILEEQSHLLIVRDTLLAANDTLRGDVLVVGATVRVEGVIAGDLVIVDANVFLRPGARVLGDVVNIAGGYYPSAQSTVAGEIEDFPNAPYDVVYGEDVRRIVGTRQPTILQPEGFRGIRKLTYDRVNGVTVSLGGRYLLPPAGPFEPFVSGFGEYYSQRGAFGGGGELGVLRNELTIAAGAQRVARTNEDWIRGALQNSVSFLVLGKDYRNYYSADRYYVRSEWTREGPAGTLRFDLRAQREDASSLTAGDPWTLFRQDSVRPNPAVDEIGIASVTLGSRGEWRGPTYQAGIDGALEFGIDGLGGDIGFGRFVIGLDWAMPALANHTLEIEGHFQGPLPGTDSLPLQRWSFVGGSGTLWTFDIGQFPGDRVVFVSTEYIIPLPESFSLPIVGPLSFELLHRVGSAWSDGVSRDFEQNVGILLGTPIAFARVVTNPRNFADDIDFDVGLRLPRGFSWTARPPE